MSEVKTKFNKFLNEMNNGLAKYIFDRLGVPLDFSEQSLVSIEDKINKCYSPIYQPPIAALLPFGYYLGETIIRNIPNAYWDTLDASDIFYASVVIKNPLAQDNQPKKVVVKPFLHVSKFWIDRTNGLVAFYRSLFCIE